MRRALRGRLYSFRPSHQSGASNVKPKDSQEIIWRLHKQLRQRQSHSYRSRIFSHSLQYLTKSAKVSRVVSIKRKLYSTLAPHFSPPGCLVSQMKVLLFTVLATMALVGVVSARGRVFNRFSPESLANLGYGGHGGMHRTPPFFEVRCEINRRTSFNFSVLPSPSPRTTWLKTNRTQWNASPATEMFARPMTTVALAPSANGTALTAGVVSSWGAVDWARFAEEMRIVSPDWFVRWPRAVWSVSAAFPCPCRSNITRSATRPRTATLRGDSVVSCSDGIAKRIERWVRIPGPVAEPWPGGIE